MWLWRAAAASIQPLAWELPCLPYAAGAALKSARARAHTHTQESLPQEGVLQLPTWLLAPYEAQTQGGLTPGHMQAPSTESGH